MQDYPFCEIFIAFGKSFSTVKSAVCMHLNQRSRFIGMQNRAVKYKNFLHNFVVRKNYINNNTVVGDATQTRDNISDVFSLFEETNFENVLNAA